MAGERRFEPWPFGIALLLLAGIGGSLAFYAVAVANPDAEVVEDAYQAGLELNETLRAERRAEERGYRLDLRTRPGTDAVEVVVSVSDAAGAPAPAERVVVRRERPAEGGFDQEFELVPGEGGFVGRVPLPRPGRWRLVATADVEDASLRRVFSLRKGSSGPAAPVR